MKTTTDSTLRHYQQHAAELARSYESADVAEIHQRLCRAFPPGAQLLELGGGSGRDAAAMLAAGFEVTLSDGSPAMLEQAEKLHPELRGRTLLHRCPAPLPLEHGTLDGVYALAMLMHLPREQIDPTIAEVARVLKPGGRLVLSVPFARDDIVSDDGRDAGGRRFTSLAPEQWAGICAGQGLQLQQSEQCPDGLGRQGISWVSMLLENN